MDTKAIVLWGGFIVICAIIYLVSRRMKKQIEEDGIEAEGVITRIVNSGDIDMADMDLCYYVRYRTQGGEEVEGILSNPRTNLEEGQRVRIKYHPKYKENLRLIE